jgi:hypothetical protein
MVLDGAKVMELAIKAKKAPPGALSFTYMDPNGVHLDTMAYAIDGARVLLLGRVWASTNRTDDRTGLPVVNIGWPSAGAWRAIAKQYQPIASKLALKLKQLVKVKMGADAEAETIAKFGPNGKEIRGW